MATSGSVLSTGGFLNVVFDWSVTYDTDNMKAVFNVSGYLRKDPSSPYSENFATMLKNSPNAIIFNGTTIWSDYARGSGSYSNPVIVYTGINSLCANKTGGPYTAGELANKYCWGWARFFTNYKFSVPLDSEGNTSLHIVAQFQGGYAGNISTLDTTIIPTKADVGSKIGHMENNSWTTNGRIWHMENGTWVKRNLYRKQSDVLNDWKKV